MVKSMHNVVIKNNYPMQFSKADQEKSIQQMLSATSMQKLAEQFGLAQRKDEFLAQLPMSQMAFQGTPDVSYVSSSSSSYPPSSSIISTISSSSSSSLHPPLHPSTFTSMQEPHPSDPSAYPIHTSIQLPSSFTPLPSSSSSPSSSISLSIDGTSSASASSSASTMNQQASSPSSLFLDLISSRNRASTFKCLYVILFGRAAMWSKNYYIHISSSQRPFTKCAFISFFIHYSDEKKSHLDDSFHSY
ncbi:uncharacterized protein MONOS_14118 [Monocercomonoides exilis]|uniref:uncharacterized protein n=1 Tax=Monocercomonoides exilis TaxID=2049356 RepID=UPI00355A6B2A|nr:hypothetical protein MONOS_14118 [Monocercomonoides exilis]|eukprot:MONOS_14118.1-p1 / transcript=MONOS_14118.1 / gene=MONOS_14118 / organism=Monocercomonoides_exilis_PA203 / gene_product=unspecified product / transcript_product=unspecified product / location=Mono_scaffold00941:12138-12875(+) / protein_length=246 / sequence_SO=supercontig / SO=protein_coding / is_pseudo=false